MIKLTLQQCLASKEAIKALSNQKMPAAIVFKITKLLNKLLDETDSFEAIRNAKIIEYGTAEVDKDGKETGHFYVKPGTDALNKLNDELIPLLNHVVEFDMDEINPKDLPKIEIEPVHIAKLGWLFVE
jgi:hypothetical protein